MGRFTKFLILALVACSAEAALRPEQLAVIINDADPNSVAVGEYYIERRGIPAENVVRARFAYDKPVLSSAAFKRVYDDVRVRTPKSIQAYALTWTNPIRVNCMSITTAFAMGYGTRHCAKGCRAIAPSPYFNSHSQHPYSDHNIRPTMSIAARTVENAKRVIDRGVQSDGRHPQAAAYFVITTDAARNSRSPAFHAAKRELGRAIPITIAHANAIRDRFDIMFYFTGATHVPHLDSIGFLPGAMADHLTSAGGRLMNSPQMSALRWLEAGATGSYGTVVEPCNFPQKFPNPAIAMAHYLAGDTLVEAYWKSVVWPGQGIFIGEPLARPYAVSTGVEPGDTGATEHE